MLTEPIKIENAVKDITGRTTMLSYMLNKLTKSLEQIRRETNYLLQSADKLDLDAIIKATNGLKAEKEAYKELCEEACANLTVVDIVANAAYFDADRIAYYFKYTSNGISIANRDLLVKAFGYRLKEAKVI